MGMESNGVPKLAHRIERKGAENFDIVKLCQMLFSSIIRLSTYVVTRLQEIYIYTRWLPHVWKLCLSLKDVLEVQRLVADLSIVRHALGTLFSLLLVASNQDEPDNGNTATSKQLHPETYAIAHDETRCGVIRVNLAGHNTRDVGDGDEKRQCGASLGIGGDVVCNPGEKERVECIH